MGLDSLVSGFIQGVDVRHAWDDRKAQKALDAEDREWLRKNRDWATADREYTLEERRRLREEQDRLLAEAEAERQAQKDAYDAAKEAERTGQPNPLSVSTSDGRSVLPATGMGGGGLSFGLPSVGDPMAIPTGGRGIIPPPVSGPAGGPVPAPTQGRAISGPTPQTNTPASLSFGLPPADAIRPRSVMAQVPTVQTPTGPADPSGYESVKRIDQAIADAEAQLSTQGFPARDIASPGKADAFEATQRRIAELRAAREAEVARISAAMNLPAQKPGAAPAPAPRAATETVAMPQPALAFGNVQPQAPAPRSGRSLAAAPAAAPQTTAPPMAAAAAEAPATPPAAAPAAPAAQAPAAAPPSVEVAAATAAAPEVAPPAGRGRLAYNFNAPAKVTPEAETQAVGSFMDTYLKVGVPKMVDYYLKTGQFEKAKAFDQWAKDGKVQQAMQLWAKGVHAAAIGDEAALLKNFTAYYNSFEDGYDVVESKSGLRRDEAGNVVGVTLTFKDTATGEVFTQELDGTEDLLQQGIYAMSPEAMFDLMWKQMESANEVRAAGQKADAELIQKIILAGLDKGDTKTTPERVASAMKALEEASPGFADLPPEQKVAAVVARIRAEDQASTTILQGAPLETEVPIMRRPGG